MRQNLFGEPPEAEAEPAPGATIYVRVPTSLKDRIEAQATREHLSVNAWAIRCMESCLLAKTAEALGADR